MRIATTFIAATSLVLAMTPAQAGGLSPEIMETPEPIEEVAPTTGSSVNSTFIIVGILAALLIAAAINANDDDDDAGTPAPTNGTDQ